MVVITTPEPPPQVTTESRNTRTSRSTLTGGSGLFPPVVITIPAPEKPAAKPKETTAKVLPEAADDEIVERDEPIEPPPPDKPAAVVKRTRTVPEGSAKTLAIERCVLSVSEENVSLEASGRDVAVIVGREDDGVLDDLTAMSTNPADVSIRRQIIAGVTLRALFVLRSESSKTGLYHVTFEMPCGKKEISVRVR
jgi:hypothetical protein